MPVLPSGTIALLFTDVEGFTHHCAENEAAALAALRRHDVILRKVIEGRGGVVFKTVGDAFHAAFSLPRDALAAAIDAQNRLHSEKTKETGLTLRVRMALHVGTPECRDDDYFGLSVNAIARLRDIGHGDQILASQVFYEMIHRTTGPDIAFRSLHAWHLKGMPHPETVFQVIAPGLHDDFPPLRAVSESVGNLPILLSSFIGRVRSLRQIATQVEQHKLVTLRGAGGCGKTRLAIEAARPLAPDFPGGVWLVRLDGLDDPDLIARETVRVLRLFQPPGQTASEALIDRLRERPTLILLDNCEHLLKGCARFAHDLLTVCPDLRILATSREPLGVPGEFVRDVPPLPLPRGVGKLTLPVLQASEAVQLFTARAEAGSGFMLSRQNALAVTDICRALDGIPLALEMAARWVGVLPLDEIAAELVALVNDPPGDSDPDIVPARQRTMRATVDWSFARLDPAEQSFFLHLAVFVGGFTLQAARAVAGEAAGSSVRALHLLKSLVDRSLIFFDETAKPEARYRLLEPVREVAAEKLAETAEEQSARDRHGDWFLTYALRAEPELQGADSALWLDRLEADHENLRTALKGTTDPATRLRLAVALHRFWLIRGHLAEGSARLIEALDAAAPTLTPELRVQGLNAAGILAYVRQDFADAAVCFREALRAYHVLGDTIGSAKCLNNLGNAEERSGHFKEAQSLFEEALVLYRSLSDDAHVASVLSNLGMVSYQREDYDTAIGFFRESIMLHQKSENTSDLAVAINNLGIVLFDKGDFAAALVQHQESFRLRNALKHEQGMVDSLLQIAFCYSALGSNVSAVESYAATNAALQMASSATLPADERNRYEADMNRLRTILGESVFRDIWERC